MKVADAINHEKIIAIIRGVDEHTADHTVQSLIAGGIRILEVTANTAGALQMIFRWRSAYEGKAYIGMGTVLNYAMAKEAVQAGAQFFVSPNVNEKVITYGAEQEIAVFSGAMTPTEIYQAWNAGATAVKVFPANTLGPGYIREVLAPLNQVPIIATGGMHMDNIKDFLNAGAVAVGIGSSLVSKKLIHEKRFGELEQLAAKLISIVKGEG